MSGKSEKSAVKVMVRVRPFNKRELNLEDGEIPNSIVVMNGPDGAVQILDTDQCVKDNFDVHQTFWSIPPDQNQYHCSRQYADQENVFQFTGAPAVKAAMSAKHCCIFAYGQTGSGKTYSMLGSDDDPGISPRIVDKLYEELEAIGSRQAGFDFSVEISFMEIYNEKVKDLLVIMNEEAENDEDEQPKKRPKRKKSLMAPSSPDRRLSKADRRASTVGRKSRKSNDDQDDEDTKAYKDLRVRNSPAIGVYIEGLTRLGRAEGINSADDVKRIMKAGMIHRATAETNMNATSSRSHAIFQMCLRSKNEARGIQRYANINLVDLAGSERITMSGAKGERLIEATKINLSLSTLRRVIDVLIQNYQRKKNEPKLVPPYRDSMLTWILSESLGGNSVTMMLATVSPYEGNREDTVNTLRYALKAKSIVNTVRVNEEKGNVVLSAMQREMLELKAQLEQEQGNPDSENALNAELLGLEEEMQKQLEAKQRTREQLKREEEEIDRKRAEAQRKMEEIENLRQERLDEQKEAEIAQKTAIEEQLQIIQESKDRKARAAEATNELLENEMRVKAELKNAKDEVARREELFRSEVKLVKRKQFALAFHKAFARAGQTSGLDRLEEEVKVMFDKISTASYENDKSSLEARAYSRSNDILQDRIIRLERELAGTEKQLSLTQEVQYERISDLQEGKKQAEDECRVSKEKCKKTKATYSVLSEMFQKTKANNDRQQSQLCARTDVLTDGLQKKTEYEKQLKDQLTILNQEIESLRTCCDENTSKYEENNQKLEATKVSIAEEKTKRDGQQAEFRDLETSIAERKLDIISLMRKCEELREVVSDVTRNHGDLKRFVSYRFFASGDYEGPPVGKPTLPEDYQFDGDRVWMRAGYAYRRSGSPLTNRSLSPITPRRHVSNSPARSVTTVGSRSKSSKSPTANKLSSRSPNSARGKYTLPV